MTSLNSSSKKRIGNIVVVVECFGFIGRGMYCDLICSLKRQKLSCMFSCGSAAERSQVYGTGSISASRAEGLTASSQSHVIQKQNSLLWKVLLNILVLAYHCFPVWTPALGLKPNALKTI